MQVIEWSERMPRVRSGPWLESGWRTCTACHIPSLSPFLSIHCQRKVSMPQKIFKKKKIIIMMRGIWWGNSEWSSRQLLLTPLQHPPGSCCCHLEGRSGPLQESLDAPGPSALWHHIVSWCGNCDIVWIILIVWSTLCTFRQTLLIMSVPNTYINLCSLWTWCLLKRDCYSRFTNSICNWFCISD